MKKIGGTPKTLRELFTGVKYTIHYYQREYQWQRKQVEELIEDLTEEFYEYYSEEDELKNVINYGHYFLGSVVLTEDDNAIIDGQQRLTSLTLLLLYLYHNLADTEDKAEVLNLIYSRRSGERTYNIHVPEREECLDAIKSGIAFEPSGHPESVQNIYARYCDITELMNDILDDKSLPFFKDWLIDNVEFIRILAQTEQDAHKIFVSMNDRGLNLTPTEMLKGFLLSEISADRERYQANDIWKAQILKLKSLGKEEESDFIKNWIRSQYAQTIRERKKGAVPEDFDIIGTAFHKWIRENTTVIGLKRSSDYVRFVCDEFTKFSELYLRIHSYSQNLVKGFEHIFFNANRNFTLQPQLIMAAIDPTDPTSIVELKLKVVSCFLDNYLIRRIFNFKTVDYSAMTYSIFMLSKRIRRKSISELVEILTTELTGMEFQLDGIPRFALNGWTSRYMLHILARLTYHVETESGLDSRFETYVDREIKNSFDVEHVLADHYRRHIDEFKTEKEFSDHRNMFGGLLILPKDKNRSFQDYTFEQKNLKYFGENLLAKSLNENCYQNNPQFLKFIEENHLGFKPYNTFKKESVFERQVLYQQISERIWDIDRLRKLIESHA